MKIVQIITALNLGGAQTLLENLCYGLAEEGQDVTVVSLESEHSPVAKRLEAKGIQVLYLEKKPHFDIHITGKLAEALKELKPDVIHAHNIRKLYVLGAARKAGVRHVVYTVHNIAQREQDTIGGIFSYFVFHTGLMVPVGLTPMVTESIKQRYHLKDVETIYNGTDLDRFSPKADYTLQEHPMLLNIARLEEQKNHRMLFTAFQTVLAAFPKAELTIVGDGQLEAELKELASSQGIREKVHFEGRKDDVAPYFPAADLFVMSSTYEGMPMTLIEAMASGMPIVTTNVGGIPDMLTNEDSALLTSTDAASLAEAIIRVMSDAELRQRLGKKASEASIRFSHLTMARSYLELYQRINKRT